MSDYKNIYYKPPRGYNSLSFVYKKRGLVAKVARFIHERHPSKRTLNAGWNIEPIEQNTIIGKVVGFDEDGTVIVKVGGYYDE